MEFATSEGRECTVSISSARRPSQMPTPQARADLGRHISPHVPSVVGFELASYPRIEDHVDPKGGGPVYIVDQNLTVRSQARGIKRLDVLLALNAHGTVASVAGVPDADGSVEV